jgi:hypothetical protein
MKRLLIATILSIVVSTGCSVLANSELSRARSRWQAAKINHYTYRLMVGCFCPFQDKMPLKIEVQDGQVVSMTYPDGSPVSGQDLATFAPYQTIDSLFDFTSVAVGKADEIKTEYDPKYGYPTRVQIDYIKQAMDDELALSVSDFEPLP